MAACTPLGQTAVCRGIERSLWGMPLFIMFSEALYFCLSAKWTMWTCSSSGYTNNCSSVLVSAVSSFRLVNKDGFFMGFFIHRKSSASLGVTDQSEDLLSVFFSSLMFDAGSRLIYSFFKEYCILIPLPRVLVFVFHSVWAVDIAVIFILVSWWSW